MVICGRDSEGGTSDSVCAKDIVSVLLALSCVTDLHLYFILLISLSLLLNKNLCCYSYGDSEDSQYLCILKHSEINIMDEHVGEEAKV